MLPGMSPSIKKMWLRSRYVTGFALNQNFRQARVRKMTTYSTMKGDL